MGSKDWLMHIDNSCMMIEPRKPGSKRQVAGDRMHDTEGGRRKAMCRWIGFEYQHGKKIDQ